MKIPKRDGDNNVEKPLVLIFNRTVTDETHIAAREQIEKRKEEEDRRRVKKKLSNHDRLRAGCQTMLFSLSCSP